ncbi:hypothetical protein LXA43DRAFT_9044 [Ganoderma leucocontextum]|nr:hypothetical protein LXA43DRAFT_9044 [Ganoderma leucocontextum]
MSFSTTATTTFELMKYSSAYSPSPQGELEWQHFINPVIRLMLDTRKTSDGRLESYKIRIIWTFSAGQDSMDVDRREVTFEDLELMTYSGLPSQQPTQGIPLKAVYQGPVVGLRYQHPCLPPPGVTPQYRRFQITFQNESSATNFIDCIRFICPCKPNTGPPARGPRPPQTRPPISGPSRSSTTAHTARAAPRPPASNLRPTMSSMALDAPLPATSATALPKSSSLNKLLNRDAPPHGGEPPTPPSAFLSSASPAMTISPAAQHSSSDLSAPDTYANRSVRVHGTSNDIEMTGPSSSLPSSSPPAYTSRPVPSSPVLMPPPPVPPQASLPRSTQPSQATPTSTPRTGSSATLVTAQPTPSPRSAIPELKSEIVATLTDSDGLYALSKEELEKLVAEVIREEGFVELMRRLDGMWKIKGLAGIHNG